MRPIPIKGEDLKRIAIREGDPNAVCVVMSAPDGNLLDDDIRPLEAASFVGPLGQAYGIVIQLEDGDLDKLKANGGKLYLSMVSGVVPFDIEVFE